MEDGHYIGILVPNQDMWTMLNWIDEFIPDWKPLPCTKYSKTSYWNMLSGIADQDAHGLQQFITFHVPSSKDVIFAKLSWDVVENYPWSEHN